MYFLLDAVTYKACLVSRSVRPTIRGLVINVDVSHAIVCVCALRVPSLCLCTSDSLSVILISYEQMPVLEWMCTFLSKFSSRRQRVQLQDLDRLAESDIKLLKAVLKGVRVTVTVPSGRHPARPIKDLVPNVGDYHFMKEDEETTIKVCSVICCRHF